MLEVLTDKIDLTIRIMGQDVPIDAIATTDDEANDYMAEHDAASVIASIGQFVFLADRNDIGLNKPLVMTRAMALKRLTARGIPAHESDDNEMLKIKLEPVLRRTIRIKGQGIAIDSSKKETI